MKLKNYILPLIISTSNFTSCINYETEKAQLVKIEKTQNIVSTYNCLGNETKRNTLPTYVLTLNSLKDSQEYKIDIKGIWMLPPETIDKKLNELEKSLGKEITYLKRIGKKTFVSDKTHKGYNYLFDIKTN